MISANEWIIKETPRMKKLLDEFCTVPTIAVDQVHFKPSSSSVKPSFLSCWNLAMDVHSFDPFFSKPFPLFCRSWRRVWSIYTLLFRSSFHFTLWQNRLPRGSASNFFSCLDSYWSPRNELGSRYGNNFPSINFKSWCYVKRYIWIWSFIPQVSLILPGLPGGPPPGLPAGRPPSIFLYRYSWMWSIFSLW